MIAQLKLPDNTVYTLNDTGVWTGVNPHHALYLNALASTADLSPATGAPYRAHVLNIAAQYKAQYYFEPKAPDPEGTIY